MGGAVLGKEVGVNFKNTVSGAGEMVQELRALAALVEDPRFGSQKPTWNLQPYITPVPGGPRLLTSEDTKHTCDVYIYTKANGHAHKNK